MALGSFQVADWPPHERRPIRDHDLIEPDNAAPFPHHGIQEADRRRADHLGNHSQTADVLRIDDVVGTAPQELLAYRELPLGADDADLGVEPLGGQRQKRVELVGGEHGEDAGSLHHPGALQGLLLRRIPFHNLQAVADEFLGYFPVLLDHDESPPGLLQLVHDNPGGMAHAAYDVVVRKLCDLFLHTSPLEYHGQLPLHDDGGECRKRVGDHADAAQDEEQGEYAARGGEGVCFSVTDSRERDHRHIERIERRPTFDEGVADRSDE